MNKALFLAILFVAAITLLPGCSTTEDPGPIMNNNPGMDMGNLNEDAPNFNLLSLNGGNVALDDFSGKPLVIFFFGSTCPLCISSAPSLESGINEMYTSNQIGMIGIDTWDGNVSAVQNFMNTTGVTFDLLLNGSQVQSDYLTTYDRLLVVDGDGKIVFKGTSSASNDVTQVVSIVNNLLQ